MINPISKQESVIQWHPLLQRQLEELLPASIDRTALIPLFKAVDASYRNADADRRQLRRSLAQTSRELIDRNSDLRRQRSLLQFTINSTDDAILVLDNDDSLLTCNDAFLEMFGLRLDAIRTQVSVYLMERLRRNIRNFEAFEQVMRFVQTHPDQPSYIQLEFNDGRYIDCYSHPRLQDQEVLGRVWSLSDVTEIKRSEQQARYHTEHDSLTGLLNRNAFLNRLNQILSGEQPTPSSLAVLFLDLDGFKYVNDTLGHEYGDELLKQTALRLKAVLNKEGVLARHGGDEFIILLDNLQSSFGAIRVAESIQRIMQAPFHIQDQDIHVTTSIGIALYPNDSDRAETLVRKADMALYHAKNQGRNNYQFFAEELERLSSHRLRLRNNLKQALAREEFRLLYQPKIDLTTRRMVGCEALIRWHRPDGEIIPPLEFIPVAEENGMIIEISEWVIETACRAMARWRDEGHADFSVAINVSALHFQKGDLLGCVDRALRSTGIAPNQLELEITESIAMANLTRTTEILKAIRELGVRCAIDDFGTGYSSLNYLKQLPLDHLKIDKVFVDELVLCERNRALVRTIIDLAHHLGLGVIAEGVETEDMAQILDSLGCDYAQGYYFSRPVEAAKLTEMLSLQAGDR